MYLYLRRVNSS